MAVAGRGVTVRPPRPGDAEAMARWLSRAPLGLAERPGVARRAAALVEAGDPSVRVIDAGGEACGVIVMGRNGDRAVIELIAVRPEARGRGLAAKALIAIEESMRPAPGRIVAPVAPNDGRSLYFWLRLGYRPVVGANGRVEMERTTRGPS